MVLRKVWPDAGFPIAPLQGQHTPPTQTPGGACRNPIWLFPADRRRDKPLNYLRSDWCEISLSDSPLSRQADQRQKQRALSDQPADPRLAALEATVAALVERDSRQETRIAVLEAAEARRAKGRARQAAYAARQGEGAVMAQFPLSEALVEQLADEGWLGRDCMDQREAVQAAALRKLVADASAQPFGRRRTV